MSHTRFAAFLVGALALLPRPAAAQFDPDPPICQAVKASFTKTGFLDWHHALDPCWKTGETSWTKIFMCGFNNLPDINRMECVRTFLWQAPITQTTIADIIEFNSDAACTPTIDKYKNSSYLVWTAAIHACRNSTGPSCLYDDIFECAWNTLPGTDQKPCLRDHLAKDAPITQHAIGEVRGGCALRDSVAANQTKVNLAGLGPEQCDLPQNDSVSADYFAVTAPDIVLDRDGSNRTIDRVTGKNLGDNEGRLRADLRQVARLARPRDCSLPLAAYNYALAEDTVDPRASAELIITARAYADLSVTGRRAFEAFRTDPPGAMYCMDIMHQAVARGCFALPTASISPDKVVAGCGAALDRAYAVANYLRTGQTVTAAGPWVDANGMQMPGALIDRRRKERARAALGWIAVSGEDDQPHRPVNVPSSDSPQFDIEVEVEAPFQLLGMELPFPPMPVRVDARYVIAQSRSGGLIPAAPARWSLAPDYPLSLGRDSEVLFFIHGMDSRAEEAEDLTRFLFARMAATESRKNLVIVSVDLPTSGYTEALDWRVVSPLTAIGHPDGNTDFRATGHTPLLDFLETFVVRFAEKLDADPRVNGTLLTNVKGVIGGSLGGNLSFRLGRRPNTPWIPAVVVWSPASVWTSLGAGANFLVHGGPRMTWFDANDRDLGDPDDLSSPWIGKRWELFNRIWDNAMHPFVSFLSQPQSWFSTNYLCWRAAIHQSRLDRHETYTSEFRTWRWRLASEQLLFSHHTIDAATGHPRYHANDKRMLLACGTADDVKGADICENTEITAGRMWFTPGEALYLEDTGHALHNERPRYWALQIQTFLGL